jgi:hypothetical protein
MKFYEGRMPASYGIFNRWSVFTRGRCYTVSDEEKDYLMIKMHVTTLHVCRNFGVTVSFMNARVSHRCDDNDNMFREDEDNMLRGEEQK